MIVSITAEAEADLEQIAAHIAEQSPKSALKLVRALRARSESLLDVPRGYPLVPRYEHLAFGDAPSGGF